MSERPGRLKYALIELALLCAVLGFAKNQYMSISSIAGAVLILVSFIDGREWRQSHPDKSPDRRAA